MRSPWIRSGVVAIIVVALVAGVWTVAAPPQPRFVIKCTKYTCTSPGVCEDPYPGSGLCTQGKHGPGFGANISCCCCSDDDASNRWFHGE